MITAQRRALILDYLREHGGGSIVDIAAALGASKSSIRRDLDHLAALGTITRSRGGAIMGSNPMTTFEPPRRIGAKTLHEEKIAIGMAASQMVEPGSSIILDSSTTVLELARILAQKDMPITACTNDLEIAYAFAPCSNANLIVLGGSLRPGTMTLVGEPLTGFLERLHLDITFLGIHSLAGGRLSETSIEVSVAKQRMIRSAARVVVLADSSKFEHPAFFEVAGLDAVETVVTDASISDEHQTMLRENGIGFLIADQ